MGAEPRREPRLELLVRDREAVRLHSEQLLRPDLPVPERARRVIGGSVVRDPELPSFAGQYLFGRFSSGRIVRLGPHAAPPAHDTGLTVANISGFGEDGLGRLYATSLDGPV